MDLTAFYRGESFDAHEFFGAHLDPVTAHRDPSAPRGATFRAYAPAAAGVTLLLERDADEAGRGAREVAMRPLDGGVFEARAEDVAPGDPYELRIHHPDGSWRDHADPYGFGMDLRPRHRSIVRDLHAFEFSDDAWMRGRTACHDRPLNIYEVHAGSWVKPRDAEGNERPDLWYRYDELADRLVAYLLEQGYTHVEFLPLTEYPADESWGYQPVGLFSPTSRYGTAEQLTYLVDRLHRAGLGAILDFVPVHFANDPWGLARFDGTCLYEYPNDDVGLSEWGSLNFMHSRGEVASLVKSAASLWLGTYHFDGLRLDAVSRVIYWQGDERRGENGAGIALLRSLCEGLHARHPGCMLVAEDSSSRAGITAEAAAGGLGFDYKWDLGWMHDTLSLLQAPPEERPARYHQLTFSMHYFPNERYLLPLSHDEVVHGKATVAQKMSGDYWGKFGQARTLYLYMAAHPGKMLNFMGSEFAQLREWDERREQDWCLLGFPVHDAFRRFVQRLNHLYLEHPALWQRDYEPGGFEWLDCAEEDRALYAFARRGTLPDSAGAEETLACLLNLGADETDGWEVPLPSWLATGCRAVRTETILHTEWESFGGSLADGAPAAVADAGGLSCTLPPQSGALLLLR